MSLPRLGQMMQNWLSSLLSIMKKGVSAVFYMAILSQKPFCQKSSVLHLGLASGIGTWNPYMNMGRAQAFGGSLICSQLKIYLSLFLVWQPRLHVPLNRLQR